MQIHLSEVLSQPDQTKTYTGALTLTQLTYCGAVYPVRAGEPVHLAITHKGKKKLTIALAVRAAVTVPCDRCLKEVEVPLAFTSELKVDMNQTDEDRIRNLEEAAFIEGYTLDVDRLVEGELFVHMPMKVLCSEDCGGLAGIEGTAADSEACDGDEAGLDPRMAVVRDLFRNSRTSDDASARR